MTTDPAEAPSFRVPIDESDSSSTSRFLPLKILTSLPNHEQLIPLLMKYGVLGFQTDGDVQNFVRYLISEPHQKGRAFESADRHITVTVNGRETLIGSFPVGIEPHTFTRIARRNEQAPLVKNFVASLGGRSLIIGVDRLDYSPRDLSSGSTHSKSFLRITANGTEKLPICRSPQQIVPKFPNMPIAGSIGIRCRSHQRKIWRGVLDTDPLCNPRASSLDLAGLYRTTRVGLVTPLCDGMNLVAKEYIAAQDPADPGVLILSRFADAASKLPSAYW